MKTLLLPSRVLFVAALAAVAMLHAQSNATPPALGLLRLKSATRPNDAAPLAAGKFSVDDLSATGVAGTIKSKHNNVGLRGTGQRQGVGAAVARERL